MQTNIPDIYAVGDAVEVEDFITKKPAFIPLAGPANKQGRIAADNIAGYLWFIWFWLIFVSALNRIR